MSFDILWRCLLALSGMVLPWLTFQPGGNQPAQRVTVQTASPSPTATASPVVTAKPSATPSPTATPVKLPASTRTPAPAPAARSEIASEQVCPGQSDPTKTTTALVCLTSAARQFHGLPGVSADNAIMAAAAAKASDMGNCGYSHTACGRAANYWMTQKGYAGRCSGENIARGQTTPRAVFEGWMKSPGHRANILNRDYHHIGVATAPSPAGRMWVMQLGGC